MNNTQTTSYATANAAGTTVGTQFASGLSRFDHLTAYVTIVGGTGGTTDVTLQTSPDGTNWYDWGRTEDVAAGATDAFKITGSLDNKVTKVGKGNTPVIAKGSVAAGSFGDRMRAITIRGTGASAAGSVAIELEGTFERHR